MYNTQPAARVVGNAFGLAWYFGDSLVGVEVEYLDQEKLSPTQPDVEYSIIIPDLTLKSKVSLQLEQLTHLIHEEKVLVVLVVPSYSSPHLIKRSHQWVDWCKTMVTSHSKDLRVVMVGDVVTPGHISPASVLGKVVGLISKHQEPVVSSDSLWYPVLVTDVVAASKKALFSGGTKGNVYQLNGQATPLIASILQLRAELAWDEYQPTLLELPGVITTLDPQQIALSWRLLKRNPTSPTATELASGVNVQADEVVVEVEPKPEPLTQDTHQPTLVSLETMVTPPPDLLPPNPTPPVATLPSPTSILTPITPPPVVVESIRAFVSSVELEPEPVPEVESEDNDLKHIDTPINNSINTPNPTLPETQKSFSLHQERSKWKPAIIAFGLAVLGAGLTLVLCVAIQVVILRTQLNRVVESVQMADLDSLRQVSRGLEDSTERVVMTSKLTWGLVDLFASDSQLANLEAGLRALQQVSDMVILASATADEIEMVIESVSGQSTGEIYTHLVLIQSGLSRLSQETQQLLATFESFPFLQRYLNGYDQATLLEVVTVLDQAAMMAKHAPVLLGIPERQTYAILLQNNAELRPTGGFIGSFALVTFEAGRLLDLRVEDVYAADGQLQGFVEPPAPIKAHLGEVSWFLRDVNWDPEFPITSERAAWFIDKELGIKVNGVLAITLDVAEALLQVTGPLYLPDYQITVSSDNLYQQAQFQSEIHFFPGSTQKRDFLGAVTGELYRSLTTSIPLPQLAGVVVDGLRERSIQAWFFDSSVASSWQQTQWAGQLPGLDCHNASGECVKDVVAVIDANLGVNKANYYVNRDIEYQANLTSPGTLASRVVVRYTNNSPANTWPGGRYKNYLRLFTPQGSILTKVSVNGLVVELGDVDTDTLRGMKVYGLLVEVPSAGVSLVTFEYQRSIPSGSPISYQLSHFKQAGSPDQPLVTKIVLPPSSQLLHTHPAVVVADNQISLAKPFDSDQSLVVEFTR